MERLIDKESAEMLKRDFAETLKKTVDVKIRTNGRNEYSAFTIQLFKELEEMGGGRIKVTSTPVIEVPGSAVTDPIVRIGEDLGYSLTFNGTPAGHEVNTVIEMIKLASRGESTLTSSDRQALKMLDKKVHVQVFVTPSCPYCPMSAVLAAKVAVENPAFVSVEVVEAQENMELSQKYSVSSVPQQVLNGEMDSITTGGQKESDFVKQIVHYGTKDSGTADEKMAAILAESEKLGDNPTEVITLTDRNFDEAVKKYPALVADFWAPWCAPCRMLGPIVESMAQDFAGKVVFGKLNVDENPAIAGRYSVDTIPTLLFFGSGELKHNHIGVLQKVPFAAELEKHLGVK